jgi:hypothetical protein
MNDCGAVVSVVIALGACQRLCCVVHNEAISIADRAVMVHSAKVEAHVAFKFHVFCSFFFMAHIR